MPNDLRRKRTILCRGTVFREIYCVQDRHEG